MPSRTRSPSPAESRSCRNRSALACSSVESADVNACLLGNPRHALPSGRTHPLPEVSFNSHAVTPRWSSPQAPA
jgi:hypothetical protein